MDSSAPETLRDLGVPVQEAQKGVWSLDLDPAPALGHTLFLTLEMKQARQPSPGLRSGGNGGCCAPGPDRRPPTWFYTPSAPGEWSPILTFHGKSTGKFEKCQSRTPPPESLNSLLYLGHQGFLKAPR